MCGARLFAVRVILLQRYKVLPACLPDFGSLTMLSKGSSNGRLYAFARLCITTTLTRAAYRCVQHLRGKKQEAGHAEAHL